MTEKTNAVFIVESQPPTFSEVLALFQIVDSFEHIFLCVQNSPMVIDTGQVLAQWETIIKDYKNKITLTFGDSDFKSVSKIPEKYQNCKLLTISQEIFVHLQSLNVDIGLLPRISGYEGTFMRAAYRQSKALEWIRQHTRKR